MNANDVAGNRFCSITLICALFQRPGSKPGCCFFCHTVKNPVFPGGDNPAPAFVHLFTRWTLLAVRCTMEAETIGFRCFVPLRCSMKSYWIAAAVLIVTAWPSSKASAISAQQPLADGTPQSSAPPANVTSPVQAAVTAKPAAEGAATVTAPAAKTETVKPKDSYILVELSNTLKAKKLKVGDKVKAEVSQDVVSHGKVIIPVETKLVGHVTEVSARDSTNPESRLGIVFDRILLKHFRDIDFEAVVQAVSQPVVRRSRVDEPLLMLPPSMMGVSRDAT